MKGLDLAFRFGLRDSKYFLNLRDTSIPAVINDAKALKKYQKLMKTRIR